LLALLAPKFVILKEAQVQYFIFNSLSIYQNNFKKLNLIVFWTLKASYKLVKLLPNINSNN
jgi:hypothetical protein